MEYILIFLVAFLILLGFHFIPWAQLAGRKRLRNVEAYVIGTSAVTAIQMAALTLWPSGHCVLIVLVAVCGSGAGVVAGYFIDKQIENQQLLQRLAQQVNDAGEREQMLMELRNE